MIVLFQPPFFIPEPPFFFQAGIQRRARKRQQMIEGGCVKAVTQGKVERFLYGLLVVRVVAENKSGVNVNARIVNCVNELIPLFDQMMAFAHLPQILVVQAFKTDQENLATGFFHSAQKGGIFSGQQRALPGPFDVFFFQPAKQFHGMRAVGYEIVIDEKKIPVAVLLHIPENVIDRAPVIAGAVGRRNSAEFTRMNTAAPGFNQTHRQVFFPFIQAEIRQRRGKGGLAAIDFLQFVRFQIRKHRLPDAFGIACHDRIGMGGRFFRFQGDMIPAKDNPYAPLSQPGSQFVGAKRRIGFHDDRAGVVIRLFLQQLQAVVVQIHLIFFRCESL